MIATSDFTAPALEEASNYWRIDLVNFQGIVEALKKARLLVREPATFKADLDQPIHGVQTKMYRFAVSVSRA